MGRKMLALLVAYSLLWCTGSINIVNASVFLMDTIVFTEQEKYQSYVPYEDEYGAFENSNNRDVIVLTKPGQSDIYLMHKEPAYIHIKTASDETKKAIEEYIKNKGIDKDAIEISGFPNIGVHAKKLDIITEELANELCCYLTEKKLIDDFRYRDQCYYANRIELVNNYLLDSADDAEKISKLAEQNDYQIDGNGKYFEDEGLFSYSYKINNSEDAQTYIEFAELVCKELSYKPAYIMYQDTGIIIPPESEILFSGNYKDNKIGDVIINNNIDLTDLTAMSLYLLGDIKLNEDQLKLADVDSDGKITLADLARLRQYLSKKINAL